MGAPTTSNTRLIVGLTGPEMLTNKKHVEQMETYESRAAQVLEFVRGIVDVTPFDCRGAISTQEEGEVLVATFKEWRGEDEEGEDEAKKLRVEISELKDPFGPTITEEGVTALVVTKETESGGAAVNRKREDRGWKTLEVGVVGLLMDRGAKLSSTELRRQAGEAAKKVALG